MQFKQTVLVVLSIAIAIRGSKDNPLEKENRYNDNVSVMINETNRSVRASQEDISTATHPDPHHNSTSTTGFSNETKKIRMRRASQEDFSTTVSQMATTARLITAISLQNGLIDGSIPSDTALAELLNIGSVDMAKLETFDKTKVDNFVQKLKTTAAAITAIASIDKVEKMTNLMTVWTKKFAQIGDVKDKTPLNAYFFILEALKSETFDRSFLPDMVTQTVTTLQSLNATKKIPEGTDQNSPGAMAHGTTLVQLKTALEKIEPLLKKSKQFLETLIKFKPVAENEFPVNSPHRHFMDLIQNLVDQNIADTGPDERTNVADSFKKLLEVSVDRDGCSEEIKEMEGIVLSRRTRSSGRYTSGLLNGHFDLKGLSDDAKDPWFKSAAAGFSSNDLWTGLKPLNDLETDITALDDSWQPLEAKVQVTRQVLNMHQKFGILKATTSVETVLKTVNECVEKKPAGVPTFSTDARKAFGNVVKLKEKFAVASQLDSNMLKSFVEVTNLKNLITFSGNMGDHAAQLADIVTNVKAFAHTDSIIDTLTSLNPVIEKIISDWGNEDLSQLVQKTATGKVALDTLLDDAKTDGLISLFTCSKGSTTQMDEILSSISLIREVKTLSTSTQQDVSTVTETIASSTPTLKKLRADVVAMRTNKDAAVAQLKAKLKIPDSAAKDFGELVTVMDNIRKVLEKKTDLETFLRDGGDVERKIKAEPDAAKKQKMLDDWGDFAETKGKVKQLLDHLENQRNSIQRTARHRRATGPSSKFSDYISTFSSFSNLPDVDLQVEKRLEVLNQLANPGFADLKNNLQGLGSLDLQFARFNAPLTQAGVTLSNLDSAFVRGGPPAPGPGQGTGVGGATQGTPQGSSNAKGPQGSLTNMLISTTAAATDMLALIGYIIAGIVAAAVVGGLLYWFIFRKKKNKDDVEATKSRRATTSTTTATGNVTPEAKAAVEVDKAVKDVDKKVKSADEKKETADKEREKAEKERKEAEQEKILADQKMAEADKAVNKAKHEMEMVKGKEEAMGRVENKVRGVIKNFNQRPKVLIVNRANMEGLVFKKVDGKFVYLLEIDKDWYRDIQLFFMHSAWFPENATILLNKLIKLKWHRKHSLISQYFEHEAIQPVNVQMSLAPLERCRAEDNQFIFNPEFAPKYNRTTPYQISQSELMPDWIHVNMIVYPVCGTVALAEAPKNTRELFIKYIFEKKCPHIVMACTTFETAKYFEWEESNGNTIQLGKFKVTVVKVEVVFDDQVAKRELLITKEDNKEQHTLTHWNFIHWDQNWSLSKTDTKYEHLFESIMKVHLATRLTEKPILVHSGLGTGRGAVFVAAECLYQSFYDKNTPLDYPTLVKSLRFQRHKFLENGYQYFFAFIAGYYYFIKANGFEDNDLPGQIEWLRTWKKLTPAALKDFEFLDKEMARKQDPPTIADDLPKEAEVAVEPTKPDEKPAEVSATQKPTEQVENKADEGEKFDSLLDFNDDTPERHKKPKIEKKIKTKTAEKVKSQEEKKSQKDKKSQKSEKKQ